MNGGGSWQGISNQQAKQTMSVISSRIHSNEKDTQTIIDLMVRVRPVNRLDDYPTKTDIEEKLAVAKIRANTRLWFDEDQPVGWAYVDDFHNLYWEFDNQHEELLNDEIIAWAEACIRNAGDSSVLDTACREDNRRRIALLQQFGFHQTQDTSVIMTRPLSEPISQPELPNGFVIRPITRIEEAEAVARTHRAAFGTENMTTEKRIIKRSTSGYDPSMDLVVLAPDGSIAAYTICSINEQTKIGFTDPVATHPRYQRMGLARALLLTGLHLLKERGMLFAYLGTDGDNTRMQKAATSAGFSIDHKTSWFSKEVH
jgi:GNAT superfamily N-acetyltransferase